MANYKSIDGGETPVPANARDDVKEALSAITKVITNAVGSDRADRFAEVERLSKVAQSLCRAVATRVEDFDDEQGVGMNIYQNDAVAYAEGRIRRNRRGQLINEVAYNIGGNVGPNDADEVRRQLLETEGVRNRIEAEKDLAELRLTKTRELHYLVQPINPYGGTLASTDPGLKRRVEVLKDELVNGNLHLQRGDEDEVVHPELPRGHQPGGEGQGNGAASRESEPERGEGAQAAQGQGAP